MSAIHFYPVASGTPVWDVRARDAIRALYENAKQISNEGRLQEAFNAFKQTSHLVRANAHILGYEGWVRKVQRHLADLAWRLWQGDIAQFECDILCAFSGKRNYEMTETHYL